MTFGVDSAQRRVLVVDDEPILAGTVATYLQRAGFRTQVAADGGAAVQEARSWAPDVIVLDLGLPVLDGLEVCRHVRTFSDCYVLMLTARDDEVDKLVGLSVGADDYMTKPFSARELVARIQVLLRRPRSAAAASGVRELGDLSIDVNGRQIAVGGRPVALTKTEFDLLAVLASRPEQVFTRRMLTDMVWGENWVGDEHGIDVHVANMRRKLGDDPAVPRFILTVRGVGYRMGAG